MSLLAGTEICNASCPFCVSKMTGTRGLTKANTLPNTLDYCVKYTVFDALDLGYNVTIIGDGCRAAKPKDPDEVDPDDNWAGLWAGYWAGYWASEWHEFLKKGAHITSSKDVLERSKHW